MTRILLAILLAGALAACGTTNVGLKYSAAPTVARASSDAQPVRVGPFADLRGESATWLCAGLRGLERPRGCAMRSTDWPRVRGPSPL